MRIVVSGSSGLIGQALTARLADDGHQTCALVRRAPGPGEARWDPPAGTIDGGALDGAGAVVHLAGAGIGDHRWTAARRAEIMNSRVETTRLLSRSLAAMAEKPAVLVSASAIGYYGDRGDEELAETSAAGRGFQADVCQAWEAATAVAEASGIRVVHLRSAVVLARQGGALGKQLPLFRAGLGGRLGSGRQWFSWITLRDELSAIIRVMEDASLSGPVNASAPEPVTNREFTSRLGAVLHRPAVAAVPAMALRLAFGRQMADDFLLGSLRVRPARLLEAGFRFEDPDIESALHEATGR